MRLASFTVRGYRSLRSVRFDLGGVTVFVGENGAGKSNLYRALQLVKASAEGRFSDEIVREGGMQSAMWGGMRRRHEPARIILEAAFEDERLASRFCYGIEAGLPPPVSGAFPFEPQIKEERISLDTGRRPVELMDRRGPAVFARDGDGRRFEHPARLLTSESGLAVLGQSGHYPEIGDLAATTNGLISEDVKPAMTNLNAAIKSAQASADTLNAAIGDARPGLQTFSKETLPEVSQLVHDLRNMAAALSSVAEKVDRNGAGSLIGRQRLPDYKPGK